MTSVIGASTRAPVRRSALFMAVVGAAALAAAIANSAASVGFPVGDGWSRVVNVLVTIDLCVIAIVLIVAAFVVGGGSRDRDRIRPTEVVLDAGGTPVSGTERVGVLVVVGLALLVVDWAVWIVFAAIGLLAQGDFYLVVAAGAAIFGPLWVLGTVLAVIGFHRGGAVRNRSLALAAAGLGLAEAVVLFAAALLCAVGAVD